MLSQQSAFFGEEPIHFLMFKYLPDLMNANYPFFFLGVYYLIKRAVTCRRQ